MREESDDDDDTVVQEEASSGEIKIAESKPKGETESVSSDKTNKSGGLRGLLNRKVKVGNVELDPEIGESFQRKEPARGPLLVADFDQTMQTGRTLVLDWTLERM